MEQTPNSHTEIFLVLEDFSPRVPFFTKTLASVWNDIRTPGLQVDILYQPKKDVALVMLRFDRPLITDQHKAQLMAKATQVGVVVLDPMRLDAKDRRLFFEDYLKRYTVRIDHVQTIVEGLRSLANLLGLNTATLATPNTGPRPTMRLGRGTVEAPVAAHSENPQEGETDGESESEDTHFFRSPGSYRHHPKRATTRHTIPGRPQAICPVSQSGLRLRFQRGDLWAMGRVRNLTTKGMRFATSAAPPLGSALRLVLSLSTHVVTVAGVVVEIVSTERSVDGSTSIRVEFREVTKAERAALVQLLRTARNMGLAITPPPPRRNTRFSISWPTAILTDGRRFQAATLDISQGGLFLATTNPLELTEVTFGMPIEHRGPGIRGRALVAREVTDQMARAQGLQRGYGLRIEDFTASAKTRFDEFLKRIRQRNQYHVVVAGNGPRLQLLGQSLQNAGYTVTKASDLETMFKRAPFDARPPDAAIIDESLGGLHQQEFQAALRVHDIPTLDNNNRAPHITRHAIDQLLKIQP